MQYWKRAFEDKVRIWEQKGNHQRHPSWVNRQESLGIFQGGGGGADGGGGGGKKRPAQIQNAPGTGKKSQKRAAAAARNAVQPPPQPYAIQNGTASGVDINARRADGRYYYHTDGKQICFKFSRFRDGCSKDCTAVPSRAHVCEFCRQPHRTIDCRVVVNWTPPPEEKGKGKGKGKEKGKGGAKGKYTAPF